MRKLLITAAFAACSYGGALAAPAADYATRDIFTDGEGKIS